MRKILVDLETGCWEWQGALDAAGYGRAHDHEAYQNGVRQTMAAHRLAWRLFKGPIPAGMLACHRCDNPRCANPEHVFLGTYQDNNRDISEKGRHRNGQKTHCKHGHAFTPENTGMQTNGGRYCRTCNAAGGRARSKARTAARQAARPPKTLCRFGRHPWIPENIMVVQRADRGPTKECRLCHNESTVRRYWRKKHGDDRDSNRQPGKRPGNKTDPAGGAVCPVLDSGQQMAEWREDNDLAQLPLFRSKEV
jgi:hypothetical protein